MKPRREEQQSYSEKKINCYKLHCDVQRKAQTIGNKELKYDPTYNIYKVEDLWNKMVKMEHQLEKRIQGYLLRAENKNSFFNQWKNEVNLVVSVCFCDMLNCPLTIGCYIAAKCMID